MPVYVEEGGPFGPCAQHTGSRRVWCGTSMGTLILPVCVGQVFWTSTDCVATSALS